jgi:putative membrane protein
MLGFGMGFGMILFWIAIIAVVVLIIKGLANNNNSTREEERSQQESPLDILKRRYAAGEIPRDEFENKKHDLIKG